ncbi:MAG TPA: MFS transporter [Micromonosporaceae bacterium]
MSFTSAGLRAVPPAHARRDVTISATARGVSVCGDFVAATALVLAVQDAGAGGWAVAAVMLASTVPPVVLAPLTGRLADRVDSRLLLVATGTAQALVCLLLAHATGIAAIVGLVAALAAGLAVVQPTLSALLPAMVSRDDLPRAAAVGQTATNLGMLAGPALGGLLVGQFGLRVPLLVDAATYLAIAVAGFAIRTRRGRRPAPADPSQPADPARWRLRTDALLLSLVVLLGAVIAAVSAVNVVEVFFVRATLHASPAAYGLLGAVYTGSMLVGSWLLTRRAPDDAGFARAMLAMLAVTCVVIATAGAVPNVAWLVPLWIIGGLVNGGENVAASVVAGRRVPADRRGRFFATLGAVSNGANAAGYLLGGALLGLLSPRPLLALTGLAGLAVVAIFAAPVLVAARRESATATEPAPAAA